MVQDKIEIRNLRHTKNSELPNEYPTRHENQVEADTTIFIRWANDLYQELISRIPKSYVIEDGKVFQNPEYGKWRYTLRLLRSNLEIKIDKHKSNRFNKRFFQRININKLHDKVSQLDNKYD